MDAAAHLKRHGWRGHGHSLDRHDRGIKKPLLISQKADLFGVGKKKTLVADQWWMRAFDESLKELGTGKQTALDQIQQNGVARGGLYGFFVRGEGLSGTISEVETPELTSGAMSPVTAVEAQRAPEPVPAPKSKKAAKPTDVDMTNGEEAAPTKKRKREETREEIRERRKKERREKERVNAALKRERAAAEGTLDLTTEAEKARAAKMVEQADQLLKKVAAAGTLSDATPQASKDTPAARRPSMEHVNADRMAMMSGTKAPPAVRPYNAGGMKSYKAAKYERGKQLREAKRAEKARLAALQNLQDVKPPTEEAEPAEEQAEKKHGEENAVKDAFKGKKGTKKAAKEKKKAKDPVLKAEEEAAKAARRVEKLALRAKRRAEKKEILEKLKTAAAGSGAGDFANGTDEIKLVVEDAATRRMRMREEKKRMQAIRKEARLAKELEKKREAKKRKLEAAAEAMRAVQAAESALTAVTAPPEAKPLSEEKKAKYAARAAEKGMTLEAYIAHRAAKKNKDSTTVAPPATDIFFVDTTGNPNVLKNPTSGTTGAGPEKQAATLTQAERNAQRKAISAEKRQTKKDRKAKRMEQKMAKQRQLTAQLLREGKVGPNAKPQEIVKARREAKKRLKKERNEEKRGKRKKPVRR
ncbi:hypothetical protein H2201_001509 [Coniosporium apollinis]|uniref:Ribosomal RNA-processing protein 14/surfeit locus protein 6 C-terminal domain-containing protein n=1 Tax=Coniosporium apollinis TaxID=61459 RepID=A0ABQ9P1I2_9PEZI|nr:hypothetical protein H2201_001509 [Coniosporium apollinis]